MDYIKFIILLQAYVGGIIFTSYANIARKKSWKIYPVFLKGKASFIFLLAYICEFGSVIASIIVNTWWSFLILVLIGSILYVILLKIFKSYSQGLSIILMVSALVLSPKFIFSHSISSRINGNENIEHFILSIEYSNKAADILNKNKPYSVVNSEKNNEIIFYKKKSLEEANLVDINELNRIYEGLGDHYKDEFIKGIQLLIAGYEGKNYEEMIEAEKILDKWGSWYNANKGRIKLKKYSVVK